LECTALRISFSYFRLRGKSTTVINKAANIKPASKHASYYFKDIGNSVMDGRANESFVYISECRKWEQREIGRVSRHMLEGKMAFGKLLEEKDIISFEYIAYRNAGILSGTPLNTWEVRQNFSAITEQGSSDSTNGH
jgi:hypothetical protein